VGEGDRRRQDDKAPELQAEPEAEALVADLDHARELFATAERRARTYLVDHDVLDQTNRDLASLLREPGPTAARDEMTRLRRE
jgi:hypothetical protein